MEGEDGHSREKTSDGKEYESRLKISKFDVENEEYDYFYMQKKWFGRSVALVYLDNGETGSNLYVGGSLDPTHIHSSNEKEWSPAITLIDSSGQVETAWRLRLGNNWETDELSHTYIDHMKIRPTKLFGTTRGSNLSTQGN